MSHTTRWNVAITLRTAFTESEIRHLTVMLSGFGGEVTALNGRILIKATSDYESSTADAIRSVVYPVEAWLRMLGKVLNYFHVEADAIDERSALAASGYAPARQGRWA